jgi:hypothetical protein
VDATDDGLPYVDEHALTVSAPPAQVWSALQEYVDAALTGPGRHLLPRLLGARPASGFAVAESVREQRLVLAGQHRFSRYRLVFALGPTDGGATLLRALTYAAFPGPHGRVYRLLVIGSRAHVVATNRMLHDIARRSTGAGSP